MMRGGCLRLRFLFCLLA